jgi:transcriptional regulator with PAS, ATPase and Fis domain
LAALERNAGNRTATAAELGISLRTLYYRLSEYQKQGYRVD